MAVYCQPPGVGIRRLVELAELLFLDDATGLVGFRRRKLPLLTGEDRRVEAVLPDVFRLLLEFHAAADAPFGAADREVSGVGEDLPVVRDDARPGYSGFSRPQSPPASV